jgi:glycogen debranching enzyme
VPFGLALKAEALHLADRTRDAVDAIAEADALAQRFEQRFWCGELHRLRGVFLTKLHGDQAEIEEEFRAAIRIAKQQNSSSLATRAEATYVEYRGALPRNL